MSNRTRVGSCTGCARRITLTRTSSSVPYCRECRVSGIVPTRSKHGTARRYAKGCRCAVCTAGKREGQRAYVQRRADRGNPVEYKRREVDRECERCGEAFGAQRSDVARGYGRFCSRGCANGARGGAKPARKSPFRRRAERVAAKAAAGSSGGGQVFVQGSCIVCGSQFLSRGAESRYCSRVCRAKNRQRSFGISWLDRMALFDRDGWTCQICSEPVNYGADPGSDWYPTLDHIVPKSLGGSHDFSNLRTAHRWCNSVRGDLSYYSDADLAVTS